VGAHGIRAVDLSQGIPVEVDLPMHALKIQDQLLTPRLLQVVVEKAAWQDGALRTTLFEPFEILCHSNRESCRKENDNEGSGRDLEIWLPEPDSNLTRRLTIAHSTLLFRGINIETATLIALLLLTRFRFHFGGHTIEILSRLTPRSKRGSKT
jgi:hypothetical protein